MRKLNDLIKMLEKERIAEPQNEREEWYNQHLDLILEKIEDWSGMNETLGHKLSVRTRNACLTHLIWMEEIEVPTKGEYFKDWFNRQLVDLSRHHLMIILNEDVRRIRNMGEKGIAEIKEALK